MQVRSNSFNTWHAENVNIYFIKTGEHSTLYYEDDPCPHLQDFKPFDLESWWGKRLYTHITNSVSTKP